MFSRVFRGAAVRCGARRWASGAGKDGEVTPSSGDVLDGAQKAMMDMFRGVEANLSDKEIERLATTHRGASLPEILGENPKGIIPEAFYEDETVDLGIAFIECVQGFEAQLTPEELTAVENLLDCYFAEPPSAQMDKYKHAVECLSVPLVRANPECVTFIAKLVQDTFHWSERRAVLTLVYYAYDELPRLAQLWRLDLPAAPLAVATADLNAFIADGTVSDALCAAVATAGTDLSDRVKDASNKRRLMALVQAAFAEFADGGEVAADDVTKTLESLSNIPECKEWITRVKEHAGENGTLDWHAFARAMVYGD
eukprot:TRINITY_DN10527_c0_g1_i1.p2 TRINITY_DN10527_c0_g1~~TRINITY_DN10527_c0_g1_i1.p2  ORF type:complete len:329 (+),score=104.28 TRINITY_DN10527_c0_g1_i1:53-988(+)